MQNPHQAPGSETDARNAPSGRKPDVHLVGNESSSRRDASTGPPLPQTQATPDDPNYHAARRVFGTSLGMFLPALILLVIGIAVIVWIAW